MKEAKCPVCGGKIKVDNRPRLGQRYNCRWCSSLLEVTEIVPFELESCYDEEDYVVAHRNGGKAKGNIPACPVCTSDVRTHQKPKLGDLLPCPSCEMQLEVVGINPVELDLPQNESLNWDRHPSVKDACWEYSDI